MKKQAFSLIELSIVILIIGVLVAGVTQGTKLLGKSQVKSAQALTQSSPVNSIKDLALWLETTSEKSFGGLEESNGNRVATWHEINPQVPFKKIATVQSSDGKALYVENVRNGLPVLRFSGLNGVDGADYYENTNFQLGNKITFFAVTSIATNATSGFRVLFLTSAGIYVGVTSSQFFVNPNIAQTSYSFGSDSNLGAKKYYVLSSTIDGTSVNGYVNGGDVGTPTTLPTIAAGASSTFYRIGTGPAWEWLADVGEIIVFNRVLTTEERKSVEKYLSQKWGVALSY